MIRAFRHGDMCFHTEIPLISFTGLIHFEITLTRFIFHGAGNGNNSGIDNYPQMKHKPSQLKLTVNQHQYPLSRIMYIPKIAKIYDSRTIWDAIFDGGKAEHHAVHLQTSRHTIAGNGYVI